MKPQKIWQDFGDTTGVCVESEHADDNKKLVSLEEIIRQAENLRDLRVSCNRKVAVGGIAKYFSGFCEGRASLFSKPFFVCFRFMNIDHGTRISHLLTMLWDIRLNFCSGSGFADIPEKSSDQ